MDQLISINEKAGGRDKFARLVQYGCRLIWDTMESSAKSKSTTTDKELIDKLKNLESVLSQFRKVLYFGRTIDSFYTCTSAINYPDFVIRTTLTLGKISGAILLFSDHILWMHKLGFLKHVNTEMWGDLSNKSWLFSIMMSLVRDMYEILELWKRSSKTQSNGVFVANKTDDVVRIDPVTAVKVLVANKPILLDTIKNSCDILIPLSSMGFVELSPKMVGLLGVVSSVVGIWTMFKPELKLSPM